MRASGALHSLGRAHPRPAQSKHIGVTSCYALQVPRIRSKAQACLAERGCASKHNEVGKGERQVLCLHWAEHIQDQGKTADGSRSDGSNMQILSGTSKTNMADGI
jgi:hypothetical protein